MAKRIAKKKLVDQATQEIRIRLARWGCTNRPFFHIVVADSKAPRNGRHYEQVGAYDPMPNDHGEKLVSLNFTRIKHWLVSGAKPTTAVAQLLGLAGLLPVHPQSYADAVKRRQLSTGPSQTSSDNDKSDSSEDTSSSDESSDTDDTSSGSNDSDESSDTDDTSSSDESSDTDDTSSGSNDSDSDKN